VRLHGSPDAQDGKEDTCRLSKILRVKKIDAELKIIDDSNVVNISPELGAKDAHSSSVFTFTDVLQGPH